MRGAEARLAVAAMLLIACGGAPEEEAEAELAPRETCAIEHVTREDRRTLHGVIDTAPDRRASVAAQAAGRIVRLLVAEGDVVEAGALLAEIEVGPASAASAQARAQSAEAAALLAAEQQSRDHLARLVERGIAPRAQLEQADGRLAALTEGARAARAASSGARRTAGWTHVTSPLAGTVLHVLRRAGEAVDGTSTTPIVEIGDARALEVVASVAPRDLLVLARDMPATVTVDGLDAPVDGRVTMVSPALDPATGTGTVRLALAVDRVLPLGLAADAVVTIGSHEATLVPADAVRAGAAGTPEVLVCEDGEAHPVAVTVGARDEGRAEITSALDPDARLVARAIGLEDGAPCRTDP